MPWCYIRKGRRLDWDYCNVRKCTAGEHTGTCTHTRTHTQALVFFLQFLPLLLLLLILPLTSSNDPSSSSPTSGPASGPSSGPSSGPRSRPVLPVRQAAALSNQQDFRRWKGLSRRPPLAGFPPGQTQKLSVRLRPHVWRDPAVVLLGSHCSPLHVGVLSLTSALPARSLTK